LNASLIAFLASGKSTLFIFNVFCKKSSVIDSFALFIISRSVNCLFQVLSAIETISSILVQTISCASFIASSIHCFEPNIPSPNVQISFNASHGTCHLLAIIHFSVIVEGMSLLYIHFHIVFNPSPTFHNQKPKAAHSAVAVAHFTMSH
jgi:hypothetical protein